MGKMSDHNSRGLNARNGPDAPCADRPNGFDDGQGPGTTPARFPSYQPNINLNRLPDYNAATRVGVGESDVRDVFDTIVAYLEDACGSSRHVSCRTHVFNDLELRRQQIGECLRVLYHDDSCPIEIVCHSDAESNATVYRLSFDRDESGGDTDEPEVVADGGVDITGTATRAGASVVRWTGERRARRFVFEPRLTGGHTRIAQRWTGEEWVTTGREIVADLVVERGVEVSRDE